MFQGTLPADVRAILRETVAAWGCEDVFVGCSGNFTAERALHGVARLHGNDVTLYSCALGGFFAGTPMRLDVRPDLDAFGFVGSKLGTPAERAASVMIASAFGRAIGKDGKPQPGAYWARQIAAYRSRWSDLVERSAAKLERTRLRLTSFYAGDVMAWLPGIDKAAGVVSYPPFWPGGYEVMFGRLSRLFDWDQPTYADIAADHLPAFLAQVTDRAHWLFVLPEPVTGYESALRAVAQTTNRGIPIYLYASSGAARVVVPAQKLAPLPGQRLTPGMTIGGTLRIGELTLPQFATLRSVYLNPAIKPGEPSKALAVWVDDVLIGAYALNGVIPGKSFMAGDISTIYMMSDFAVAPTDTKHLAKLVLYAALSSEGKLIAERVLRRRVRRMMTTAFSDHPVSMKYRGLFDLAGRKENTQYSETNDPTLPKRYQLNYVGEMGRWTLAEGLKRWKAKYGTRTADRADHPD